MRMTFFVVTALAVTFSAAIFSSAPISDGCVYADKAVKLGETLLVVQNVVLVCASGPHGPVLYQLAPNDPLAQYGVHRVLTANPLRSK